MANGHLRVIHAHLSAEYGGELILWGESERLWQEHDLEQTSAWTNTRLHPFAPAAGQLRSGLGSRSSALKTGPAQLQTALSPTAARRLDRYYSRFIQPQTTTNHRECSLRLPTSDAGHPCPSSTFAHAVNIPLEPSAELRRWQVSGLAVSPKAARAVAKHITVSQANLAAADSLLFFAYLAELSVRLVRFGALMPMSSGWQLDPGVMSKIVTQLRGSAPRVVLAQHDSEAALITLALTAFARQFALGALAAVDGATLVDEFLDEFPDESSDGDRHADELHWLQELSGRRVFAPSAERLAENDPFGLIEDYHHEQERLGLQLATAAADGIDRWAQTRAPALSEVRLRAQLTLNLQVPGDGDEGWWLEIDHTNVELTSAAAAHEQLALLTQISGDLGPISAFPASVILDSPSVIAMVEAREQLAAAGLELMLPPELAELASTRARTAVSGPANPSLGLLSADALCSYQLEVAIDGEWLSAAEQAELVAAKAPLVRVRGRWHRLDRGALARMVAACSQGQRQIDLFSAMRLGQGLAVDEVTGDLTALELAEPRTSSTLNQLGQFDQDALGIVETMPQPPGLVGQLRDYQAFGVSWLHYLERQGFGACLADDMGLGKTIQALALLEAERAALPRHERGPTLLVVPFSAVSNWEEETAKFCPKLRLHIHHGADRLGAAQLRQALTEVDVCLTSYQLVLRDREILSEISWHRLVYDEVQDIKNAATKSARAAFSLQAPRRLALSGTPVENRLAELWSLMHLLNRGLLGSQAAFQREFVTPIERDNDHAAAERLRQLVAPFILRRTKRDPLIRQQLPDKIVQTQPCPLARDQAALYQATVDGLLRSIERIDAQPRRGLILSAITQLKQICNHPLAFADDGGPLSGRSGKLAEVERIVADALAVGEKTLCFTQYPSFAHRLAPYLETQLGCSVAVFDGTLSAPRRQALRHRFNEDPDLGLLLISYGAGGRAVNMTAANHVILFDRWWNPAVEEQAADRAYRIGQEKDVYVHQLVTAGTLEERIELMLERKRGLANLVISSLAADITSLDNQALRELFSLSQRALNESWSGQ